MIGQWVGGLGTVVGLFVVAWQVRQTSRATDATTLSNVFLSFSNELKNFTAARGNNEKPEEVANAFYSLLNFLETQAAAINGKLYGSVSRKLVTDLLCSAVADSEEIAAWNDAISAGVDSPNTYLELRRFCERERHIIIAIKQHRQ
jgi:hypothetical protein